jgi:hypothetical protein
MPATTGMQEIAVMQTIAVTPATSNSRNESSNRNANTVGKPTKAETLIKVVKTATTYGKASLCSRDSIYIRNDSSRDVNSRLLESVGKSATVKKSATCSMDSGCRCQMPEMPETVWKPQASNP